MKTIKFISNTKEGWETHGKFNPLFLEVTEEETEYCFDIEMKLMNLKVNLRFIKL